MLLDEEFCGRGASHSSGSLQLERLVRRLINVRREDNINEEQEQLETSQGSLSTSKEINLAEVDDLQRVDEVRGERSPTMTRV